jgi:DNA-binding response OmpR family regulator
MPTALVIDPGTPLALEGRSLVGGRVSVHRVADAAPILAAGAETLYDLLVLTCLTVDEQQHIVSRFHAQRRWRLVPVLYTMHPETPGIAIPGTFRPEMDAIVRGTVDDGPVQRRIIAMARDGVAEADLVVAGQFELDPVRSVLRVAGLEVALTDRETEILSILLSHPNHTVTAAEIIERGWGTEADARYLQILRRHVSNIRRKLDHTPAARSVRTIRGSGYRFEARLAG